MQTAVLGKKIRRNVARRKKGGRKTVQFGQTLVGARRVFGQVCGWSLMVFFLLTVSIGLLAGYHWVTHLDFFCARILQVDGISRFSSEDIADLGRIHRRTNLLGLNIALVQRRIAASPWVLDVAVTRILPDKLQISVQEKEPRFLIRDGEKLLYADVSGAPIAPVMPEKFISLPFLEKEGAVTLSAGIEGLLRHIEHNTLPFGMKDIAWIRQDSAEQFSLFLEEPRALIQVDGTDLDATLSCLGKIWSDLRARGELSELVALFVMPGRAWVHLRSSSGGSS